MGVQGLILAIFKFCFAQRLIQLPTPDVKVVGRGGSVEADGTGILYTHYTYYYYIILYYYILLLYCTHLSSHSL